MTIHFRIPEYICENCKTPFMAYCKDLECPKCGRIEESTSEGHYFVSKQVANMMNHKRSYKRFTPSAWHMNCYGDQIQMIIFKVFDSAYTKQGLNQEQIPKDIVMYDGDGKRFVNNEYLYNLYLAVEKEYKEVKKRETWLSRLCDRIIGGIPLP